MVVGLGEMDDLRISGQVKPEIRLRHTRLAVAKCILRPTAGCKTGLLFKCESNRAREKYWYPRRDSNPRFQLRRLALYPLSYGGVPKE